MPLNRNNTTTFHRTLYGGQLETIRLLKRNDDQQEGIVTAYTIFECRRSQIIKTGEAIQQDISVGIRAIWHIPRTELDRIGISWLNVLDRIVDSRNRYWQPESDTLISLKLFENHYCLQCLRVDPPNNVQTMAN